MALADDPGLAAALAESRRSAQQATSALRSLASQLSAQRDQFRRDSAARLEVLARASRRGELGEEKRRLQERVDSGETTWQAIASGEDDDPMAVAARQDLEDNLDELADELADDEEFQRLDEQVRAEQARITGES